MAENGYVYGHEDGTYRPESSVTRAEFPTFSWHYLGSNQSTGPMTFLGVLSDAYYADAVAWMTENSLYTVNLHRAEIYWGATGGGPESDGGERVFSANSDVNPG